MTSQLGQDTGKDYLANGNEARELLKMICSSGKQNVLEVCGMKAAVFVAEQVERSNAVVTNFGVTGKQLFWLRDIKDSLVERGLL